MITCLFRVLSAFTVAVAAISGVDAVNFDSTPYEHNWRNIEHLVPTLAHDKVCHKFMDDNILFLVQPGERPHAIMKEFMPNPNDPHRCLSWLFLWNAQSAMLDKIILRGQKPKEEFNAFMYDFLMGHALSTAHFDVMHAIIDVLDLRSAEKTMNIVSKLIDSRTPWSRNRPGKKSVLVHLLNRAFESLSDAQRISLVDSLIEKYMSTNREVLASAIFSVLNEKQGIEFLVYRAGLISHRLEAVNVREFLLSRIARNRYSSIKKYWFTLFLKTKASFFHFWQLFKYLTVDELNSSHVWTFEEILKMFTEAAYAKRPDVVRAILMSFDPNQKFIREFQELMVNGEIVDDEAFNFSKQLSKFYGFSLPSTCDVQGLCDSINTINFIEGKNVDADSKKKRTREPSSSSSTNTDEDLDELVNRMQRTRFQ